MLFSVVICTYNRAALLEIALDSALAQDYPAHDFEVIVVDNHSTDATAQVTQRRMSQHTHLRYEFEAVQGLSAARNHGWQAARGRFVAYLDDDAQAPHDWLSQAANVLRTHGELDAFGGPYFASYNCPKPDWFRDAYGSWELAPQERFLLPADHLCGGNMFVRRQVFETVGGFDLALGMSGAKPAFGEETAFLRHMRQALPQARLLYSPAVSVRHLVQPRKMRLRYQLRLRFSEGRYAYLVFSDGRHSMGLHHALGLVVMPLVIGLAASVGVLVRHREKYPTWQNYYFEVVMAHVARYGKLVERTRQLMSLALKGGR